MAIRITLESKHFNSVKLWERILNSVGASATEKTKGSTPANPGSNTAGAIGLGDVGTCWKKHFDLLYLKILE